MSCLCSVDVMTQPLIPSQLPYPTCQPAPTHRNGIPISSSHNTILVINNDKPQQSGINKSPLSLYCWCPAATVRRQPGPLMTTPPRSKFTVQRSHSFTTTSAPSTTSTACLRFWMASILSCPVLLHARLSNNTVNTGGPPITSRGSFPFACSAQLDSASNIDTKKVPSFFTLRCHDGQHILYPQFRRAAGHC